LGQLAQPDSRLPGQSEGDTNRITRFHSPDPELAILFALYIKEIIIIISGKNTRIQ
jgi:hypothetical protein